MALKFLLGDSVLAPLLEQLVHLVVSLDEFHLCSAGANLGLTETFSCLCECISGGGQVTRGFQMLLFSIRSLVSFFLLFSL